VRGRPRKYPFESLRVGERMIIACGDRDPADLRRSVYTASKHFARQSAPGYRGRAEVSGDFVIFERLPDGGDRRVAVDRSLLSRLDAVSRMRPLSDGESSRLARLVRREAARGMAA
jgi:hypothetical protein